MLNRLDLLSFKCFEKLRLPLGNLTLLSGVNASGKSSVLHSLVLLHQTLQEHEGSTRLFLNGDIVKLGTVTDVVDQERGRNSFVIGLAGDAADCRWSFSGDRSDMSMELERLSIGGRHFSPPFYMLRDLIDTEGDDGSATAMVGTVKRLTYITAEREGPRDVYPLEDRHAMERQRPFVPADDPFADHQQFNTRIGSRGENTISALYWKRDDHIADALQIPGFVPTFMHQVGARMSSFFPGCSVNVQPVPQASAVTLGIRISDATEYLRPIHCGFGITQVLPIVVAALTIPQSDLFLVENPEVHLHPAGQAMMGQFLAELANYGIQVIVETHSDHVLNGIRRAVKTRTIPAEKVMLHFFRARSVDGPQVLSPVLDSSGNVDFWPEGFFDQFDRDVDFFAGWGE